MKRFVCFCLFLSVAVFSDAASAIATVTSASPFTLDGHSIATPGVTSFPLVEDDTVVASNGPAVLSFQDGSRVKLGVHSSVKLAGVVARPKLVLLSGSLDYKLVRGSILTVTNLDLERKQALTKQVPVAKPTPVRPLPPERAMLAALDTPAPVVIPPHPPAASAGSGKESTGPTFLIPPGGTGAAGLATALIRLPPVSRRL